MVACGGVVVRGEEEGEGEGPEGVEEGGEER